MTQGGRRGAEGGIETLPSDFRLPPSASAEPAIEVTDLTVAYQDKPVLWDVDVTVPPGVLMAIVGPNGAGKTTLFRLLLGQIQPSSGELRVFGENPWNNPSVQARLA